jgi:hypothetical protein
MAKQFLRRTFGHVARIALCVDLGSTFTTFRLPHGA